MTELYHIFGYVFVTYSLELSPIGDSQEAPQPQDEITHNLLEI